MGRAWLLGLLLVAAACADVQAQTANQDEAPEPLIMPVRFQPGLLSERQRRSLQALKADAVPIQLGAYAVEVGLGTPAQKELALIDTGSSLVHLPCSSCKTDHCAALTLYKTDASSSFDLATCSSAPCRSICGAKFPTTPCSAGKGGCLASACQCSNDLCYFQYGFGDGSRFVAAVSQDKFSLPAVPAFKGATVTFGCAVQTSPGPSGTEVYRVGAPFFLGMDFESGSLFSQLLSAKAIDGALGFCLGDGNTGDYASNQLSPGLLVLGSAKPTNKMTTAVAPLINAATWKDKADVAHKGMWVQLSGLAIGAKAGAKNYVPAAKPFSMLVDSGQTNLGLPVPVWTAVKPDLLKAIAAVSVVKSVAYNDQYAAYEVTLKQSICDAAALDKAFPPLVFSFGPAKGGAKVAWSGSRYLNLARKRPNCDYYWINVWDSHGDAPDRSGFLGNAFLSRVWVQASTTTNKITFGLPDSCKSLAFGKRRVHRKE